MNFSPEQIQDFNKLTNVYGYKELFFIEDLILIPLFLFLIFKFLKYWRERQPVAIQQYFILGYGVRLLGILVFLIHHILIYKGGVDSFTYYWSSNQLYNLFKIDPSSSLTLIFSSYDTYIPENINLDLNKFIFMNQESIIIKASALISFFCFNSYVVISMILGLFAYGGCWRIYKVFYHFYPHLSKPLAITCLFIPSVFFWSSVISKEIVCIGAMGYFFYAYFNLFFERKKLFVNMLMLILMGWLLLRVKMYILLAFTPPILLLLLISMVDTIQNKLIRRIAVPLVIVTLSYIVYWTFVNLSDNFESFSMDTILESARTTYVYLTMEGFAESRYSLGEFEPSINGVLKLAPAGMNVTLFRPYFWEANKPITLIASMESLLTLLVTLYVIFKTGIMRTLKSILTNPVILFCVIFSMVFALSVGITSGNFGTLMRYKIPMMPFYFTALVLIYYRVQKQG